MKTSDDKTPTRGNTQTAESGRDLPDLFAEAGIRPGRGIEDWLDWITKQGEAGA